MSFMNFVHIKVDHNFPTMKYSHDVMRNIENTCNVGIIVNHPPVITIDSWYVHHFQSWVVYGIVIATLITIIMVNRHITHH